MHFGLGGARTVEDIEIRWPSGRRETIRAMAVDPIYTVEEGKGIIVELCESCPRQKAGESK